MEPVNDTIVDVMKHMPSVTLTDRDSSQMNPNQSDVSLKGDHNTVTLQSSANDMQKKTSSTLTIILFVIIACMSVYNIIQDNSNKYLADVQQQHNKLLLEAKAYTDMSIAQSLNELKIEMAKSVVQAQDGNRYVISIQLIKDFDRYLIDGVNTINHRDLEALREVYKYYLSIGGNHDVPPRAFQFEQMIAKKQIVITD